MSPRVFVLLLAAMGCGGDPCPELPAAMTPARARDLVPGLESGLGVSTSRDLGPCPEELPGAPNCTPVCGVVRRTTWVWVVPVEGQSVPIDPSCPSGFSAADARSMAIAEGSTNEDGEAAWALEPGLYALLFSTQGDRCARCGAVDGDPGCRVLVESGEITVRSLVF